TITDADYVRRTYDITNSLSAPSPFNDFKSKHPEWGFPVDGIAYHPYPEEIRLSPNNVYVDRGLLRMRQALQAVGDACKQFWVTEVGYNIGQRVNGVTQTEAGQAAFMRDVYTTMSARQLDAQLCGGGLEVANVFWFKYEDFPPATGANAQQWGIVRIPIISDGGCLGGCYDPNGKPLFYRESFWTYRELAGLSVYHTYLGAVSSQ